MARHLRELARQINTAEERVRAEGRKPPPASVRLPRIGAPGAVDPDAVEYPLTAFRWEPWMLTMSSEMTEAQLTEYADWLNQVTAERLAVITRSKAATGWAVRNHAPGRHRPPGRRLRRRPSRR